MEAQLEPLQNEARSGMGKTLIIPEPARTVRFIIRSEGPPTGGIRGQKPCLGSIDALTAGLQKVSAHLEASKPALQVDLNNQ
jgi:hypothetical protein